MVEALWIKVWVDVTVWSRSDAETEKGICSAGSGSAGTWKVAGRDSLPVRGLVEVDLGCAPYAASR